MQTPMRFRLSGDRKNVAATHTGSRYLSNRNKGLQLASGGDYVDIVGVTGSNPVLPTIKINDLV
jgi:hypothetical protein